MSTMSATFLPYSSKRTDETCGCCKSNLSEPPKGALAGEVAKLAHNVDGAFHAFHESCLRNSFQTNPNCPTCSLPGHIVEEGQVEGPGAPLLIQVRSDVDIEEPENSEMVNCCSARDWKKVILPICVPGLILLSIAAALITWIKTTE